MKPLTFRAKTAIGSFLLVTTFLGFIGVIADNILVGLNRTAAASTLQSELRSIFATIEALPDNSYNDRFDPLPPGQLGLVISPAKIELLNSLVQFKPKEIAQLISLPINQLGKFHNIKGVFWALNSQIAGPGGVWKVLVVQNNDFGNLLTKRTLLLFLFLGLGLLFISTVGAWLLATFVLRPVRGMQQQAQAMIHSDAEGSLSVPRAKDELRDLATTLNELLDRLHRGLEREKQLVADVSHELRTPLSILQMRIQLVKTEMDNHPASEEIEKLSQTIKQLSSFVDNLLYMARQEKDDVDQFISAETASSIIALAVDNARVMAAIKNIGIEFDVEISSNIKLSKEGLQRILSNLLMNAINVSDMNSNIQLSLFERPDDLLLTIDDEGPGFPEEFLPIAFERFTRPDTSRTKDTGGSGLGLALVKSILDTFGADINLSNREPNGARIAVFLKKFPYPST
jgi:two-component system OmpR family sensor kinase